MIAQNKKTVADNIVTACEKTDRNPSNVTLIAVSKTKPAIQIEEAYTCGIRDFGENKVQEMIEKFDLLPKDIRWHMIGHLQRNKVKYIVDKVFLIHSVDSWKLAKEISKEAVKKKVEVNILVEVNVSGEKNKFGVRPDEVEGLIREIALLPGIHVKGLMTVAPYVDIPEDNRQYFVKLRQLCVDIKNKNIDNTSVEVLSMGMTGDYIIAVEEGTTYVRVGTGIFGERDYNTLQKSV